MPRIAARQTHRSNSVGDSVPCTCEGTCEHRIETYYRINYATPFVDHINVELDLQFSSLSVTASKLLVLIPAVFKSADHHDINALGQSYEEDLPTPALLEEEHARWVQRFVSESDPPSSCSSALRLCDPCLYPNIHTLLRIACTLPVTSAECERAGSALRRLHHYSRASMTSSRLSSLALVYIHYGFKHDVRKIISRFVRLHPRRMELESLLY